MGSHLCKEEIRESSGDWWASKRNALGVECVEAVITAGGSCSLSGATSLSSASKKLASALSLRSVIPVGIDCRNSRFWRRHPKAPSGCRSSGLPGQRLSAVRSKLSWRITWRPRRRLSICSSLCTPSDWSSDYLKKNLLFYTLSNLRWMQFSD